MAPFGQLFILVLCLSADAVVLQSCSPECPADSSGGEQVPDALDCKQYYLCLTDGRPSDNPMPCPEGHLFDAVQFECVPEEEAECGICVPTCRFRCPVESPNITFVADLGDCSKFYFCHGEDDPVELTCPPESPFFNGTSCFDDPLLCCNTCQPYCFVANTEVADPTDCRQYFLCREVGFPTGDDWFSCSEGTVFSSLKGHCDFDAPCNQPCRN